MKRRFDELDLQIKYQAVELARVNAKVAERTVNRKQAEMEAGSVGEVADIMLKRYEKLLECVSELNSLLTIHHSQSGPFSAELRAQVTKLCNTISYIASPIGAFSEEFNLQLGHVREFFSQGKDYWRDRPRFQSAFDLNCWMILDAEFDRIASTILERKVAERRNMNPYKWL